MNRHRALLIGIVSGLAVGIAATIVVARLVDGEEKVESRTVAEVRQAPPPWIASAAARFAPGGPNCPTAVNPSRTDIRMICAERGRYVCYEEQSSGFWVRPPAFGGSAANGTACEKAREAVLEAGLLPRY